VTAATTVRAGDEADTSAPVPGSYRAARRRRSALVHATQFVIIVVVIGGWQLAADAHWIDPVLFGRPSGVVERMRTWISEGTALGSLGAQIAVTLEEAFLGFVIGTVLGIVFGISLGRVRFLAEVLGPFIKVLNSIPRIVLGSIFVLILGLGLSSKVLLVIVLVFFGVFFNAFQGAREVDRNFIANATILGASRWQVTREVVLPSAFTWIIASLHVSFGFALIGAIVGEFLGAEQGLGELIRSAQGNFDANGVWAAMVIMAAVALVAEWLITRLENRLLRWRPTQLSGPDL
jgi:NitT/TauT family transport system permease protein